MSPLSLALPSIKSLFRETAHIGSLYLVNDIMNRVCLNKLSNFKYIIMFSY
jgi:hypothetical protein